MSAERTEAARPVRGTGGPENEGPENVGAENEGAQPESTETHGPDPGSTDPASPAQSAEVTQHDETQQQGEEAARGAEPPAGAERSAGPEETGADTEGEPQAAAGGHGAQAGSSAESGPAAAEPAADAEAPAGAGAGAEAEAAGEPEPQPEPQPEAPAEEPRRPRRLFKKKDMPGGLWLKCESCEKVIYRKELEQKRMVCPACGFHFTVPGRQRIEMVLDEGTWEERYAELTTLDRLSFNDKVPYAEKVARTVERTGQNEALLCGLGAIEGRPVVLAVLDFKFMGGSMGEVVGEKIALAAEVAIVERRPLVIFTSSGGARMHEGMLSLMQMAKTCSALATLGEQGGFSICVMTNPTTGGVTASFASVCDIVLAEPGALIGFAGPRVIATTIKQELPPGFQRAEFLLQKGQIDALVDREHLRSRLAHIIDFWR